MERAAGSLIKQSVWRDCSSPAKPLLHDQDWSAASFWDDNENQDQLAVSRNTWRQNLQWCSLHSLTQQHSSNTGHMPSTLLILVIKCWATGDCPLLLRISLVSRWMRIWRMSFGYKGNSDPIMLSWGHMTCIDYKVIDSTTNICWLPPTCQVLCQVLAFRRSILLVPLPQFPLHCSMESLDTTNLQDIDARWRPPQNNFFDWYTPFGNSPIIVSHILCLITHFNLKNPRSMPQCLSPLLLLKTL